jgi:predicted nucleic acid-binding protein
MSLPKCAVDSTCLIALAELELLPKLSLLFDAVRVPKAVRSEVFRRRNTKHRLQKLLTSRGFLQRCDRYDRAALDLLLIDFRQAGTRDRGEMEAIAQASQESAAVLIDDQRARRIAEVQRLEIHGTLWVLQRFHELDVISTTELRICLKRLRKSRFRLPWTQVNQMLKSLGQEPLRI